MITAVFWTPPYQSYLTRHGAISNICAKSGGHTLKKWLSGRNFNSIRVKTDMVFRKKKESEGLFKSVSMAFIILMMHMIVIASVGAMVLFYHGIINYMGWILIIGFIFFLGGAYLVFRRVKSGKKGLQEILRSPLFKGQNVEISFMGGLASFRTGRASGPRTTGDNLPGPLVQLEDPETMRIRELTELARLFEKNLLTLEEYNQAKQRIFKQNSS